MRDAERDRTRTRHHPSVSVRPLFDQARRECRDCRPHQIDRRGRDAAHGARLQHPERPLRKSPFMRSMPTAARCCGKTSSANKPGASMEATDIVLAPQWQATSWLRVRSCSASAGAYSESTRYRIKKLRERLEGVPDGLVRVIRKRHRIHFPAVP